MADYTLKNHLFSLPESVTMIGFYFHTKLFWENIMIEAEKINQLNNLLDDLHNRITDIRRYL